ncbi:MAG: transaldolase family protein [Christensenellales bacterium]|jgi:transaldolase
MIGCTLKTFGVPAVRGDEAYVNRAIDTPISLDDYRALKDIVKFVGVTDEFKNVIETFNTPEGETPAGFRREYKLAADGVLLIDLVRDISYDKNGELRPTKVLFSADSANPYEVAPISLLLANLTCNPGIVYDLFINNPKANVGGLYKTRDEVMAEIGRILGPGCDISVELNNPFEKDFNLILEEAAKFKEMFSKYRVVIKVPHTGAVTPENVHQLLDGDKKLANDYTDVQTAEALRGHNLCLKLTEAGYRVNFTLMFEPYQTQMALQARPYFINTFLRHRLVQSTNIKKFVDAYEATGDKKQLEALKAYLYSVDYFAPGNVEKVSLDDVYTLAKDTIRYRKFETAEGSDGLDGMRHNLRVLRNCNMPDTRLIVCSMEGPNNYPDIDKLLAEPEFMDMHHKVVITAEPNYLARFTSTNQVTSYQRRFMNAAKGQK